jgi:hypothetical protein
MELKRRFALFGFGFTIGIILLLFFLNGKNASCNFFPNERVLDILRNKHRIFSDEALQIMSDKEIDTASIIGILLKGDVDFSKSKTRQEPCRYYWIDGYLQENEASIYVQNCDTIVTIEQIYFDKK